MRIGIVGGGWMGLVLAYKLSAQGHQIKLIERGDQLGGLATYHYYGNFHWDRFYHVILSTDKALLQFLSDLGLGDSVYWKRTLTGVYVDENFYSVSNTREFLMFPPLNLWQKIRLGVTIVLASRIKDWRKLEKISVEDWLIRYSGRQTYEKFWKPLLLAKLGESYTRVSAVFIWTYIKRLFDAREDSSSRKEEMGYIKGGYKTALDQLEKVLIQRGVDILTNHTVNRIYPQRERGVSMDVNDKEESFDKVIFTGPVNILQQVADPRLVNVSNQKNNVEYLGVVCMVLVLKQPLTPYYVLNIADDRIPFTGVIGMSTLVDVAETNGNHLVYLPKYVLSSDPILKESDEEIRLRFFAGLHRMYPDLDEGNIISIHINRAFKVQPLQVLDYSNIIPQVSTRHPDFYVLNTSQFVNGTLNNDSVTRHVNQFMETVGNTFSELVPKSIKQKL